MFVVVSEVYPYSTNSLCMYIVICKLCVYYRVICVHRAAACLGQDSLAKEIANLKELTFPVRIKVK